MIWRYLGSHSMETTSVILRPWLRLGLIWLLSPTHPHFASLPSFSFELRNQLNRSLLPLSSQLAFRYSSHVHCLPPDLFSGLRLIWCAVEPILQLYEFEVFKCTYIDFRVGSPSEIWKDIKMSNFVEGNYVRHKLGIVYLLFLFFCFVWAGLRVVRFSILFLTRTLVLKVTDHVVSYCFFCGSHRTVHQFFA